MATGPHHWVFDTARTDLAPCYIIWSLTPGQSLFNISAFLARREKDIWSLRDRYSGASGATMDNVTGALRSNHRRTRPQNQDISCWGIDIPVGIPNYEALPRLSSTNANNYFAVLPRPQGRTKEGSSRCL